MTSNHHAPVIRFKGFTDAWEQRKFSEIWRRTSVKNKDLKYNQNDIISVAKMQYADRVNNSSEDYMKTYFELKKGDIAFEGNKSKEYSHGRFVLNDLADGIVSHVFITFEPIINMNTEYMKEYINNENIMKHLLVKSTTKTLMMTTLNTKDINKQSLLVPSIDEQTKIGKFFKQLDDTIALHQRELDLLKEQKKGFLQKMFPKKDEVVPEIRFAGFTDAWEQRKLGEVFKQTVEYVNPIKENLELWSVTVEKGLTPKTERYNREALVKKNDKFKVVHPGEIVYNPMNMTIGSIGYNTTDKSVAVSGYYVTMKMNIGFNNNFFYTWLPSFKAINLYRVYATGSLIEKQRIQFPTLSSINVLIPLLDEQTKIGNFFKQLDDTIALHQCELEKLQEMKKAFLQKMFV